MLPLMDRIPLPAEGILWIPLLVVAGLFLLHLLDRRDRRG